MWLLSLFLAVFPAVSGAAEFRLGTGETAWATVLQYVLAPFEKASGIKVDYLKVGSGKAFLELLKGNVEATTSDATLEELLAKAKKDGVEPGSAEQFRTVPLAKFKVAAVVHKDNPVASLSKDQLVAVFSGKATNWKEVGGPDLPILIVWNKLSEGTNYLFTKTILDKTPISTEKMDVDRNEEVRQTVSTTAEAVGILPTGIVDASVKAIEIPDVSKDILFVTKGEPNHAAKKFLQFLQGEGRKYLK
jgi:phosphate transport system substrate-binding protein